VLPSSLVTMLSIQKLPGRYVEAASLPPVFGLISTPTTSKPALLYPMTAPPTQQNRSSSSAFSQEAQGFVSSVAAGPLFLLWLNLKRASMIWSIPSVSRPIGLPLTRPLRSNPVEF